MRGRESAKYGALMMACCLALGGCASEDQRVVEGIKPGDYGAVLPYATSDMRGKHIGLISDIDIRTQLESGLMDLSKTYFSPSDVNFRTHVFLDYDELDATDGSRGLLGTLRDGNPNGLNPGSNEEFDTGNGVVRGPILINDLYELDFYSGDSLKGIAIGLAVSDAVDSDGQRIEIAPEKMRAFLEQTSTKIVSYMRERFNEIRTDVPILVAAYELNTDPASHSKGGYIFTEYFKGQNVTRTAVEEEYLIVPSTQFTQQQPKMAEEFANFRSSVSTVLSDTTYTTAQAKISDGTVLRLNITITAHGKTVSEILAVIQSVREDLSLFSDTTCMYKVTITNNGETCALLERDTGNDDVQVLSIY